MLRHRLVEREGKSKCVGKDVRDFVCVEQRRHLCFARRALHSLTDIEDGVEALPAHKRLGKVPYSAYPNGLLAEVRQGLANRIDSLGRVEFRCLLFTESHCEIVGTEVERDPNTHNGPIAPGFFRAFRSDRDSDRRRPRNCEAEDRRRPGR